MGLASPDYMPESIRNTSSWIARIRIHMHIGIFGSVTDESIDRFKSKVAGTVHIASYIGNLRLSLCHTVWHYCVDKV